MWLTATPNNKWMYKNPPRSKCQRDSETPFNPSQFSIYLKVIAVVVFISYKGELRIQVIENCVNLLYGVR